jgi:glycine/D-amino acid oxidase-like deaminating enzyme
VLIGGPSFWFHELGGLPSPRQPLAGPLDVDVAIVGGGFTGLWTAYYLRRDAPELEVALLEREVCGYGASGRNGGWVCGELPGFHDARSRAAAAETVREVGRVCAAEEIDCGFRHGGMLLVATNGPQLADLRAAALRDGDAVLDPPALAERLRVAGALGGLFVPQYARIQPARLARGLAGVVERLGARVHEGTAVREIAPGVARTDAGDVRARVVVRATEGYTPSLRGLERTIVPPRSTMIVTEPLPAAVWDELGWGEHEVVMDNAHAYVYIQRTVDGRIAIGGRGRPYYFGSRHDRHGEVENWAIDGLTQRLHRYFPAARPYAIEHAWSGVFGALRDWKMRIALDPGTGLATAGGYVGGGVAAANLSGRVLADLIRGERSELTALPCVNRPEPRAWEPEPLRFGGANAIYWLLRQADRNEDRSGRRSRLRDVARAMGAWTHR